jgi:hypothetical protein
MRPLRFVLPLLALAALLSSGCVLTSAQVLATYDLPDPLVVQSGATLSRVDVDLSTVAAYREHKDQLKGVADLALLGRFTNLAGSPALGLRMYITRDLTTLPDAAALTQAGSPAIPVWGPFDLPAGESTTAISWDQSAGLFKTGKGPLIEEIKGDGKFSLYLVGSTGTFDVKVENGAIVVVIDGGI